VPVKDKEVFDCAELPAKQPKPAEPGLAIITNAGNLGAMAADALADYDYEPVVLSPETLQKLDGILPPYWTKRNPIDMLGEVKPEFYRKVVEICLNSKEVNVIFNQAGIATFDSPKFAVRAFMDIYRFSRNIEMLQQIPSRLPKRLEFDRETAKNLIRKGLGTQTGLLTEMEAKTLLSSFRNSFFSYSSGVL